MRFDASDAVCGSDSESSAIDVCGKAIGGYASHRNPKAIVFVLAAPAQDFDACCVESVAAGTTTGAVGVLETVVGCGAESGSTGAREMNASEFFWRGRKEGGTFVWSARKEGREGLWRGPKGPRRR